jgi:RND superfamily putative drug exporter
VERWTRFVLRHRWPVLAAWLVVLLAGGVASQKLAPLLSNEFKVPGTDSERARTILTQRFGDRSDGNFLVVARVADSHDAGVAAAIQAEMRRAALRVPGAHADRLRPAGAHVLLGTITTTLDLKGAKKATAVLRERLGHVRGATIYLTGAGALQADLDPIFSQDLKVGELYIAIPIALAILVIVFGVSWAVAIPFLFAFATINGTLGIVFLVAHRMDMASYVTNLVQLIGLAISIDYSLLIVYRFREELAAGDSTDEAVVRTMATAGRATIFSGATVAIGLALLLFMPLPFMQSMGVGGFLIPLISIAAAATLQPALLSAFGRRGTRRVPVVAALRRRGMPLPQVVGRGGGLWVRLARGIMARPALFLLVGAALLVAAATPALGIALTPGSNRGTPSSPPSVRGYKLLSDAVGPGALGPTQVVVDSGHAGGAVSAAVQAAVGRLAVEARRDRETVVVRTGATPPFVDPARRYVQLQISGKHEYGASESQAFAKRLRATLIPAARFPAGTRVLAGGGPPQGVDFLHQAYSTFPWLVLGVLVLTYVLLMRAFRSWVLPLKAVLLNLLSVGSSYGVLVLVFQHGWGHDLIPHVYEMPQIEGWIPIFLFATLFGLSMDYEVFLVSRMREEWDAGVGNERAVASGLEHTGVIITAAAIIMVAAFSGFVAGRVAGLQEFGLGLAVAILVDATLVRAILVPSLMALFGRYNWWLPAGLARVVRTEASPLAPRAG